MDVQRGGPVLSLSMPILGPQPGIYQDLDFARQMTIQQQQDEQQQQADSSNRLDIKLDGFLGVAALDISFASLAEALALEGEADPEEAYGFLVDNNGLVHYHPK